jgi:hypothetical protein
MGAWGVLAFDNDDANDWAYGLDELSDLSLIEAAFDEAEAARDYLEAPTSCAALAACEVLARLKGNPGYQNGYTEKVDAWVTKHPLKPSLPLCIRAGKVIDLILSPNSELRELWDDSDHGEAWRAAVEDLRNRLQR